MKQSFIIRKQHPRLTLFFAGWGMDERPFAEVRPADSDLLVCYDYRSLDIDLSSLSGYREWRVVAWSMGVWAAGQALAGKPLPPGGRTAVNGTPFPVDDGRGIPGAIFRGTLEGLDERTLQKFYRRMCGGAEALGRFLACRPARPLDELRDELRSIGGRAAELPADGFRWTRALVGEGDRIFPPEAQRRAWRERGTEQESVPAAHYDERLLRDCLTGEGAWT